MQGIKPAQIQNRNNENIAVKQGKNGRGLYVVSEISGGVLVGSFNGHSYWAKSETMLPAVAANTAVPIGRNWFIDGLPNSFSRFINHSCNANCYAANQLDIVTLRPIKAGEELTINYSLICDSDWEVPGGKCLCGSKNCHGVILPWRKLPKKEQVKLLPYTADWIVLREMKEKGYLKKLMSEL